MIQSDQYFSDGLKLETIKIDGFKQESLFRRVFSGAMFVFQGCMPFNQKETTLVAMKVCMNCIKHIST